MSREELADIIPKIFNMQDIEICESCHSFIHNDDFIECDEDDCEVTWCENCTDSRKGGGSCDKCLRQICGICNHNCDEEMKEYQDTVSAFYSNPDIFRVGETYSLCYANPGRGFLAQHVKFVSVTDDPEKSLIFSYYDKPFKVTLRPKVPTYTGIESVDWKTSMNVGALMWHDQEGNFIWHNDHPDKSTD